MTDELENFQNLVWSSLSPIRKRIVGRERVNDLISITLEQSPVRLLHHVVSGSVGEQVVVDEWHTGVRRMYCLLDSQFGPIFWLLLSPVLSVIIQKLLEWWWDRDRTAFFAVRSAVLWRLGRT